MEISDEEIDLLGEIALGAISDLFNYGAENKAIRKQLRDLILPHINNQLVAVDSLGINRSNFCAELFKLSIRGACAIPLMLASKQENPDRELTKKFAFDLLSDILRHEISGVTDHYFDEEIDKSTAT